MSHSLNNFLLLYNIYIQLVDKYLEDNKKNMY